MCQSFSFGPRQYATTTVLRQIPLLGLNNNIPLLKLNIQLLVANILAPAITFLHLAVQLSFVWIKHTLPWVMSHSHGLQVIYLNQQLFGFILLLYHLDLRNILLSLCFLGVYDPLTWFSLTYVNFMVFSPIMCIFHEIAGLVPIACVMAF